MRLPSDALLQDLPSYWGFSYFGRGVSLHVCPNKVQPLLLTLDVGYFLRAFAPDLGCGVSHISCSRLQHRSKQWLHSIGAASRWAPKREKKKKKKRLQNCHSKDNQEARVVESFLYFRGWQQECLDSCPLSKTFIGTGTGLHEETVQLALMVNLKLAMWWSDLHHVDCFKFS